MIKTEFHLIQNFDSYAISALGFLCFGPSLQRTLATRASQSH